MLNMEWVWHEEYWFPYNASGPRYNWSVFDNKPGSSEYMPQSRDLHWAFLIGLGLLVVRFAVERLFVEPLGYWLGVSRKYRPRPPSNPTLEEAYLQKAQLGDKQIQALSKQTDLTVRQIQIWLHKRHNVDCPTPMQKFKECSWHLIFYSSSSVYGFVVLWDKPWFEKTLNCWVDWPLQPVTTDVYWYYMLELGFYWGLVLTLFSDHKRKDFTEMMVHHFATMVLIYFSWMMNFVRAGTLVLLVHDVSDPFLALAKMCKYIKSEKGTEVFFVIFLVVWYISRLGIYPFKILYCTTVEPFEIITESFFGYRFFNFFLYVLQVLHIMWSYSITKIVVNKLTKGELDDIRSDSDDDDHQPATPTLNGHGNGACATQNGYSKPS